MWHSSPPRFKSANPARARLGVEALEDRTTPGFLAPVTSPGGGGSLSVGDFNHDHRDDIAALGPRNTVAVSLGQGDGTFRPSASLGGAGGSLYQVAVRDVNGDGNPDVVATGSSKQKHKGTGFDGPIYGFVNYTNVWLGRGDGTFSPVSTTSANAFSAIWPIPVQNPTSAAADFNNDGLEDGVSLNPTTGTLFLRVDGPNGFQDTSFSVGPNAISVAVGDFNGDGWTDIILVNQESSTSTSVSVLFNDGNW